MERKYGDDFGFEIITEGNFEDQGFCISTIMIRLSCTAMNEWLMSRVSNIHMYETKQEQKTYKAQKEAMRAAWERKILDKLKFTGETGYSITQSVSEIFTVVLFENA